MRMNFLIALNVKILKSEMQYCLKVVINDAAFKKEAKIGNKN